MDNNRLTELLSKYQGNTCTDEELAELENWYVSLNMDVTSPEQTGTDLFAAEMLREFRNKLALRADARNQDSKQAPVRTISAWRRIAAVAATVFIIGVLWFVVERSPKDRKTTSPKEIASQDIKAPRLS